MRRLSISSFVSPGPRDPMPVFFAAPPSLDSSLPCPTSRGAVYFSCASSTCNLPSAVLACAAKMSRMSILRSITCTSREMASSSDLICDGDSSQSKITMSASRLVHSSDSSRTLPLPNTVLLSGASRSCVRIATVSPPAVSRSRSSSRRPIRHSSSPPCGWIAQRMPFFVSFSTLLFSVCSILYSPH